VGDHAALFYRTKTEQLAYALPFIATGLKRGLRCIYISDDHPVFEILGRLQALGINTTDAQNKRALRVATKKETYLRHGVFEPQLIVAGFHAEVEQALRDGFTGLRAAGEMSWALDQPSALSRLIEYEEDLQARWHDHLSGLCLFDETRFPAYVIDEMVRIHPIVIRGGKIVRQSTRRETSMRPA
jgi:hypothetical protein